MVTRFPLAGRLLRESSPAVGDGAGVSSPSLELAITALPHTVPRCSEGQPHPYVFGHFTNPGGDIVLARVFAVIVRPLADRCRNDRGAFIEALRESGDDHGCEQSCYCEEHISGQRCSVLGAEVVQRT